MAACEQDESWIMASGEEAEHLGACRDAIDAAGGDPGIVAKLKAALQCAIARIEIANAEGDALPPWLPAVKAVLAKAGKEGAR